MLYCTKLIINLIINNSSMTQLYAKRVIQLSTKFLISPAMHNLPRITNQTTITINFNHIIWRWCQETNQGAFIIGGPPNTFLEELKSVNLAKNILERVINITKIFLDFQVNQHLMRKRVICWSVACILNS